jgi:predicted RNase H-like HicB family nuclease
MNVLPGVAPHAARKLPNPRPLGGLLPYPEDMDHQHEVELVFAPQHEGGYHVFAPDLPGLHTQGDTLDEAAANAREALELYVEGLREEGRSLDAGVIRRRFPVSL